MVGNWPSTNAPAHAGRYTSDTRRTPSRMGSMMFLNLAKGIASRLREQQVAVLIHSRLIAWMDERGRVEFLDDRWTGNHISGIQPIAVVNRASDKGVALGEIDAPASFFASAM